LSYHSERSDLGKAVLSLERAREGVRYRVALIARPESLNDRTWQGAVLRLEELGMFAGEMLEKSGSLGPLAAIIVKVGGSRVAVSRDLARSVLLRAV
jgi:Fe2+ transport system protein FeoA